MAAARRKSLGGEMDAYDRDNIRHLLECYGCSECDGLDEYYRKCGCRRRMRHHTHASDLCPVCGTAMVTPTGS